MSLPIKRDGYEWNTVATGTGIVSTNRRTGATFSGSLPEFTDFLTHNLEGVGQLFNTAVPVGIAPTGAVAANGAITAGTAFAVTYPGIWLALPAAAAFTLSPAGTYFCVFSSTTVGTIYNITLAAGQVPYIPTAAQLTAGAIVDARGSTAYTGITTITALSTVTVPAGLVGPNGSINISILGSHTNSAGAKTYTVKGGSATWMSSAPTTTATANFTPVITNRGSQAVNISTGIGTVGNGASTQLVTAVDTSAAVAVTFNGTLAVATDWIVYEAMSIIVAPKQ